MRTGCYVMTPPGIATILGPPVNQKPILPMHSGLMETEWYHSELFCVFDCPTFEDRILLIPPDTVLAQFYFVSKSADERSTIVFSESDQGARPAYRKRSIEVGLDQVRRGTNVGPSKLTGVKSLSVACPHCWVSITSAAENGVPKNHIQIHDFYQGYKALRGEYHNLQSNNKERDVKFGSYINQSK